MDAIFKEMPVFDKNREDYLSDDEYRELQKALLENPKAGAVIKGTGGLRKMRWANSGGGKGKRGGLAGNLLLVCFGTPIFDVYPL